MKTILRTKDLKPQSTWLLSRAELSKLHRAGVAQPWAPLFSIPTPPSRVSPLEAKDKTTLDQSPVAQEPAM